MKTLSPETQVLLRFGKSNGWLDNQPAAITRAYGKGQITYIGGILDDKLMTVAAEWMLRDSGVSPIFGLVPDGVEVSRRRGAGKDVFILINTTQESRSVSLPRRMKLLLAGKESNAVDLPPYGVEVLVENTQR
jgi:beta-galactosidase